jgi:hypothetical protein
MKIFCHVPRESWIVDRMGLEFKEHSSHEISFDKIDNSTDVVWLLAAWCWNQIPVEILKRKKVVCTIHHEVPEKFDEKRKNNFLLRDTIVDYYLTYTEETKELIESLSNKPVAIIPHWINTSLWKNLDKKKTRSDLNLPEDKFIVGSFQRDTEGHDLMSPKLEKGPDIFVDKILDISKFKDVHVLLGGWRRQYVMKKLSEHRIPMSYIELANEATINKMYNCLDLYIVSSRCEGGPQAIFESAYLRTPIISTKTGQYKFLSNHVIYDFEEKISQIKVNSAISCCDQNYSNIKSLLDYQHIKNYDRYFEEIK